MVSSPVWGQLDFEAAPINYDSAPTSDPVRRLWNRVDKGETQLAFDPEFGYLKSVLQELQIPITSQGLVFSKTSFQLRRIDPDHPRAIYFNDDVYIGWVQGGDVIEVASSDPEQGAIFYMIPQKEVEHPTLIRDRGQCIVCHASSRTLGVPGHLVRSVYPSQSGQPFFGSGTFNTDHRSPFQERWGGWYVTGTHGNLRHMGNVTASQEASSEHLDREKGANITDLADRCTIERYLSPHSDIVSLMVLEHQTRMHNLITFANFETRSAQHYDKVMNEALQRPADFRSDSARRRIESSAERLVEYLLFGQEFPLTDPILGTSRFTDEFVARGPQDRQGRSLRELDLTRRLMRYPCSYLIYSDPFDHLPAEVKEVVYQRLFRILTATSPEKSFEHLSAEDRINILQILRDTKPDLPSYWREG